MDGYPNKKEKVWHGDLVSETRFYVNSWLEKELPKLSGSVVNIGAGNSTVPKKLLDASKITKYTTFDKKYYGDSKNIVDVRGDIMSMPTEWSGKWDNAICIEVLECVENPFKAIEEIYRILVPKGLMLLTSPFNVGWFGYGSTPDSLKKKNHVKDYWRITKDGLGLITKQFSSVKIEGFGGTGEWDRYSYCVKAVK